MSLVSANTALFVPNISLVEDRVQIKITNNTLAISQLLLNSSLVGEH